VAHHRAGRLDQAMACYREVLAQSGDQPDAAHLLGLALLERGHPEATGWLERSVALRPRDPAYRASLGNAWLARGELDAAIDAYRQSVALGPTAATHANLGEALRRRGRRQEADQQLRRAIELDDSLLAPLVNLAALRLDEGRAADAETLLQRATALAPRDPTVLVNRGCAARALGELGAAEAHFRAALEVAPDRPDALRGLGAVLTLQGRTADAVGVLRAVETRDDCDPDTLTNLGVALAADGQLLAALAAHDRAVEQAPDLGVVWLNRAATLQALGRFEEAESDATRAIVRGEVVTGWTARGGIEAERGALDLAIESIHRALAADPEYADAHWNLSLALLAAGQLAEGWREYEWRWQASTRTGPFRDPGCPAWDGEPVAGQRVLVWREQGLGDELLFLTCLDDLVAAGATVTALVSPRLVSLVRRSWPAVEVLADGDSVTAGGPADRHLPLGSLPRLFRASLGAFPRRETVLRPDPALVAEWRERIAALGSGPKLGWCWRSGLQTSQRSRQYAPVASWAPVLGTPGVTWVNLQYDDCEAELAQVERATGLTIHRWPDLDLRDDLESVAALISALDGVVTAPTAVSSFAGALGVRTWQLDAGTDWTAHGEPRSPWFPSIELVRRGPAERGWIDAMDRLRGELTAWIGER